MKTLKELKPLEDYNRKSKEWKSLGSPKYNITKWNDNKGNYSLTKLKYSYHGTSMKDAQNILKKGVKNTGISLTGNHHEAASFAKQRGNSSNDHGAVLRIENRYLSPRLVQKNDDDTDRHIFHKGTIPRKAVKLFGQVSNTINETADFDLPPWRRRSNPEARLKWKKIIDDLPLDNAELKLIKRKKMEDMNKGPKTLAVRLKYPH